MDKELFNCVDSELKARLLHLLLTTKNDEFNVKALVASVLRKLPLSGELVAIELKKMVGDKGVKITQPRRSTRFDFRPLELLSVLKQMSFQVWGSFYGSCSRQSNERTGVDTRHCTLGIPTREEKNGKRRFSRA